MLPLGYKNLAEHEMKVLYRAWEGQLFIQNQQVCDIVLRSPFQASIPAQLPAKLEFKYIVRISELRKKLPEAAFKKNSYSNDEACCQQLSFRLYQVEILEESELKDQLIGSMKEKNLALVKYLNDHGILLFLTSSVLAKEKDAEVNDLGSLQALFLFPSPGPRHLAATDWKREEGRSETPQQLPLILPLLRRALAGAAKNPNPKQFPSSALVKLHMQEFADLDSRSALNCDNTAGPPLTSKLLSETPKGPPVDDTRSPSTFSNLAFYLSDPESYTLEMASATAACLKGRSQLSDGCAGLNLDPSPPDGPDKAAGTGKGPFDGHGPSRDTASKSSPAGERSLQWTKRKSSRILGASSKKKWSPLKMYCILESSKKKTKEKEKRKKKKKKKKKLPKEVMTLNTPLVKDPGSPADPKRPTLKLKNILNPLRRKRGAEVLSAEFIQGPRSVSLEGAPESSAGPAMEEKKPRLNMAAKVKNVDKMDAKGPTPRKNIHGVSSEKQRTEADSIEKDMVTLDAHQMPSRGEECDSHALNLLADLALSSCNSPLDGNNRRDFGRFRPSWEHRLPRGKFLHKSSDHEYHRATKKRKSTFLLGQTSRSSLWPAKDKDGPLNTKDRSGMNPVKKKKVRINLAKTSLTLPNETGDLSDSSAIISLEHSYASPISETPQKATPHSPNSRNGVKQDKLGPLVGKVLPFQHQQNWCQPGKPVTNHLSPARSTVLANRLRQEFATSRQVMSCDETVQVTLQWEAKYVFDLDSKYTNDSLEKTIIRAVHGPWDRSLPDNLEDMKLILHMWMALFYGKPAPTPTVRKVVEHRNPAKYVSLNSLVEPLEPIGDGGVPHVPEERPAASQPEAVQIPAEGGEDGSVSPPEKLLPGNEVSSTNSLEEESPLTKLEATKDLLEKEGLSPPPKSVDEAVEAEPKEQTSLHPVLPVETPPGNPSICQTKTERSQETMLVETSQNEASVPSGPPEGRRNQEPIASTEVAVVVPSRGSDIGSSSEELKKDNLPVGGPNPGTLKGEGLKADVESRELTNPGNGVRNQPRLCTEERDGESVDLGSIDLWLSKSNDADMEVRDMDLVSEDEEDPLESGATGREETDGISDDRLPGQGSLPSRESCPDALAGHPTEFPSVQEAAVPLSSSSVSPSQMGLMDTVPQQEISCPPVTVDEKMAGSTSSSVSPNQMGLMDTVPQQEIPCPPVTVDEKMAGTTSSSVSPCQMGLMDAVPQQAILCPPVIVDEKMAGSTLSSVSPNQMGLMDTVPQQAISCPPVTVDEKMAGSTSSSVSPNQMGLMDTVPQQAISCPPVTVDEKMAGSTSSSVSPCQMGLMDTVLQQETSFHPMTVDEKMVGSTSSSVSPCQMGSMDTVPQQEISCPPVTVDEKMVGSTSSSVSPSQMGLMDMVPQQAISCPPVTVDEKMVGSTSSSVSPCQMGLMDTVLQQETSFHPMTVDEKMVGSTSSSVSPSQMGLMDTVPQQAISCLPVTVDEKMVGSTSSSVSPCQMGLMDTVPQQAISCPPVTVDEKMVGSTSSSVSPNQMGLMDTVPQQAISCPLVIVDEKMVGSTSSSVSPCQMGLMDTVPQQAISCPPVTVDEKMVGSTSSSVSPNQMGLMDTVPQQAISCPPVTVDEKMVGSTSSSVSPCQMGSMDTISQQEISCPPVTVDEKMVGSTSSSVSPSQMGSMDTISQQEISCPPVTVDEKMVGSTSSSVSPCQMGLMDTVPQQEISCPPVTVDEKMVGSTSSSVSPGQMGLMDTILQQETSFHPVTVDEKAVGSTSSSVSPCQKRLMDTILQQETSFHPVTVDEKVVGSTSSSVSPCQMGLMDAVPHQEISCPPVTVDEKMVGSTSSSVSPNQMGLMDTVSQQETSCHPVIVDEKVVGSATDPTSPKQTDKVGKSCNEALLADSASTEASRDFPNDRTTPEGPLQSPHESAESPRVPNQVDVVDLQSVSQEDSGIHSPCLPSWQPSPVHQGASDEEPPRIQEDRPDNPLYPFFQNPMGLIEDISQDSTDFTDSAVQLCEPNNNLCVNLCVPNSVSTQQESLENQDRSVAFAQRLPLAKEMDLVESPEGDRPASPVHQEISDEAATLQDDSGAKLDLFEGSSIPQQKDCQVSQHHPTENVLGPVNEQLAEFDSVTQEEQKINQGEKIPVDSQPATEYPSLESPAAESEMSFKSETCLDQENLGDSSAREEEEAAPDDGIEKPTATTTAVAEEVHILMNELVDTVCARVAQSEETRAPKSFGWIDSALLECVTPPVSDDEGCPTGQQSHADVKWAEGHLEESSSFDDQEEDLQARVEGQGESCSSSKENTTSEPGDVSEKGNDATSAATGIFSSGGTIQAELDTTSPKRKCSWLETIESPDDYSAKVDDYDVSTLEKVRQTEASPEPPICDREDCSRGEDVGNSSFVQSKCQEDSLAEEPGSLFDQDSNEVPEDREEEAQEEAKGCVGSFEDPLPDERTEMSTSSSGTDTDSLDKSRMVDGGQDPCVDWYTTRTFERLRASPSVEFELTHSSVPGNETCKDGDWVSLEASQKMADAGSMKRNVPFGLKKGCLWSGDMDRKPEPFKDYINFSVTKKHKEKSRTFHSFSKEHHPFSRDLGSINSWSKNWDFLSDPIQNILDVESLQFHCRIQALLKRSQRSTSRVLPSKKVPLQGITEELSPGMVSEGTIARFLTRSKSPLLVTVVNPNPRTRGRYDDIHDQFPGSLHPFVPAIASSSRGGLGPKYPFPSSNLQDLTHPTRNSFPRDISSVLEEFAEFSRVMTLDRDPTATSGKARKIRYPPRPSTPLVYEDLLAELRNALHFQLTNVAQEPYRKSFSFYLMETEDDPFFGRVKNLLKKGGHSEVDLLHFCKGSGMETENLLVIVRNEDICSHIHKVPSLLRLKRCPNVTFAGVDSPEDPLDHTYQELFHSGGFVVSDGNVLEGMTVGELKEVIKTLEKLNSHGRWKWFLHYRESKKLKKDARGDLAAYAKESVLKSCQVANMTEVLHYHKCDSRSCTRFERFNCLLNLQIQHITKRFSIFLTENASASREALEDKGIFSLNITDFITTAQGMVAPSGRGFW